MTEQKLADYKKKLYVHTYRYSSIYISSDVNESERRE